MDHHGRKDARLFKGLGHRAALADAGAGHQKGLLDDLVARHLRDYDHALEDRDTAHEERRQGPRHPCHGGLYGEETEKREFEDDAVDVAVTAFRFVVVFQGQDETDNTPDDNIPVGLHHLAQVDDDLRRHRQFRSHLLEHLLENGYDEEKEDNDDDKGHDYDRDWVYHGRFDLLLKLLRLLDVDGKPLQNVVQETTLFARHDEVDEKFVKTLRIVPQGVGETRPPFYLLLDLLDDTPEIDILYLVPEDLQGLDKGEPGCDHRGELPREEQYLDVLYLLLGIVLLLPRLLRFLHGGEDDAFLSQRRPQGVAG